MHRYRLTPKNNSFACFRCRLRVRHSKYDWFAPSSVVCPECGGVCDNLGDRCPIPPKEKIQAWRDLECDYRERQRKTAAAYADWKRRLKTAVEKHSAYAEKIGLAEIAAQDALWLRALEGLPELPSVFSRPFQGDWAQRREHVAWSNIRFRDERIEHLERLLADKPNKDRRRELERRQARKNRLIVSDFFGELYYCYGNHYALVRQRGVSELGRLLPWENRVGYGYSGPTGTTAPFP